jgi:hypothetical protein
MQSKATTVAKYLAELPPDRRAAIGAVREVILRNLDKDYEEGMQYGMIAYYVPHRVFPAGYHCDPSKPLCYAALASQKGYMSLYLMCIYGSSEQAEWFREAWAKTGKRLDSGKSCIRFKKIEDVAMEVVGEAIRRVPARKYIEHYEKLLSGRGKGSAPAKKSAARGATRKPGAKRAAGRASGSKARGRAKAAR